MDETERIAVAGGLWILSGVLTVAIGAYLYYLPCIGCSAAVFQSQNGSHLGTVAIGMAVVAMGAIIIISRKEIAGLRTRMKARSRAPSR